MKRTISVFLAMLMLALLLPFGTIETAEAATSGTCGDDLTWTLDDEGTLTISGTGAMANYSSSRAPWYSMRSSIKKIAICDSVTTIADYAFIGCDSLTEVTIGDSVTTIGEDAFLFCTSLKAFTVSADNPKYKDIDGVLFNKACTTLIQYPAGRTETTYTIGDFVTTIGDYAFSDCVSLEEVTIGDSVTTIGEDAFAFCTSLKAFTVSADNPKYKDIDGVLFNKACTTLIQYPAGRTETTYTIGDSVTTIGDDAFEYCTSLTTVTIPDSVTTIGDSAFSHCTSLTEVTIGDSVTTIGWMAFYDCTSLEEVTIPDSVTAIGDSAFSDCTSLTEVTIGDSVTTIGDYAFLRCTSLTEVTIGDSVTTIGEVAFGACASLTTVTIGDSVTTIGDMAFAWCDSLNTVIFEGEPPTSFGEDVFDDCGGRFTIYYYPKHESAWAPNGETTWNGYSIEPLDLILYGDVNLDGIVNAADASVVLRSVVGMNTLSETQLLAADVNYDGKVDAADAAMILRYVVGMVESLEP